MFMIGVILLIAGILGAGMFPATKEGFERRDLVGTVPVVIGFSMCVLSLFIWACRNLP